MMSLVRDIVNSFQSKDNKEAERNAYWKNVKECNIISNLKTIKKLKKEKNLL